MVMLLDCGGRPMRQSRAIKGCMSFFRARLLLWAHLDPSEGSPVPWPAPMQLAHQSMHYFAKQRTLTQKKLANIIILIKISAKGNKNESRSNSACLQRQRPAIKAKAAASREESKLWAGTHGRTFEPEAINSEHAAAIAPAGRDTGPTARFTHAVREAI